MLKLFCACVIFFFFSLEAQLDELNPSVATASVSTELIYIILLFVEIYKPSLATGDDDKFQSLTSASRIDMSLKLQGMKQA